MINQLRTESCSGSIDDLAHVISVDCLADCLTKASAKADYLVKAVNTGYLPNVDKHPPFRELMKNRHNAYMSLEEWIVENIPNPNEVITFMGCYVQREIMTLLALENKDYES